MPAPARISVPVKQPTPVISTTESAPNSPPSIPRTKMRVVHRRRARGRLGDTESDDELVREPHSDSDSESAVSTLESESVSESEPENGNEAKLEPRVLSPSRTPVVATASTSSAPSHSSPKPFFSQPSRDWSEMVADENANGVAALPVIDFADISSHAEATPSPEDPVPTPSPSVQGQPKTPRGGTGTASFSTGARKPAQSARQAYLTRLDSDPAYVPTLGQFWGHDDRLLDKELRSLSGWWRGRWQGRGRASRARGGLGTRGRGGLSQGWGMRGGRGRGFGNGSSSRPGDAPDEDTPAVDRSWTHDGFEELKQDDENNRQPFPFRGRGAFPRGRGNHRGNFSPRGNNLAPPGRSFSRGSSFPPPDGSPSRGGSFAPSDRSPSRDPPADRSSSPPPPPPAAHQSESQQSSTSDILRFGNGTRPWFAMKPERVWTKQFDGYLYFEAELKPVRNQGIGQGVRIKLPGKRRVNQADGLDSDALVVRVPQWNSITPWTASPISKEPLADRAIVVRLPPKKVLRKEHEVQAPEDVTTVAPPPMDDPLPFLQSGTTQPYKTLPAQASDLYSPSRLAAHHSTHTSDVLSHPRPSGSTSAPLQLPAEIPRAQETFEKVSSLANHIASSSIPQSHMDLHPQPPDSPGTASPQPPLPIMTPLPQPMASTPQPMASTFQPSSYGSPYAYAASGPPLPPGIAVSEEGVTYEIATGRTVYLHTPPPPPPPPPMQVPMYNPRPMQMHHTHSGSMHFLPPHASSMSMSVSPPAFLASPSIFALPRQSSRVEIRAPGEKGKEREVGEHLNAQGRQVGSRLVANVNAEPFTPASHVQPQAMGFYSAEAQQQAFDNAQQHHQQQQSMYQPPPYYYPGNADGGAPYGYGQQYANVDASQSQQYDSYGQGSYHQQHTVYY